MKSILTNPKNIQFKEKHHIEAWLKEAKIDKYTIHDNLIVDVIEGSVILTGIDIHYLPFQFGFIHGGFILNHTKLKSLQGCPHTVHGSFNASKNELISIDCLPNYISESCDLSANHLTQIDLNQLHLSSLNLSNNKITSFKDIHNYKNIDALNIQFNDITSLEGVPNIFSLDLGNNLVVDLNGLPQDIQKLNLWGNPLEDDEPLKNCTQVTNLCLGATQIYHLNNVPKQVKVLDISACSNLKSHFEILNFPLLEKLSVKSLYYDRKSLERYLKELSLLYIKKEQEQLEQSIQTRKINPNKMKI